MAAKRKKKITLSEFKTWLAGVQSMQPEDWHPSKENWKMILDQIDNITETVVTKEVVVQAESPASAPEPVSPNVDPRNPAYAAGAFSDVAPATIPAPSTQISTLGKQSENGGISLDIKDSDGEYESSFAG